MKIMVTGGVGFIGSHLVDRLLEMENHVITYDNLDRYYTGKESNIRHNLKKPKFAFVKASILNYPKLVKAMKNVNLVFHLAAQVGVRFSAEHPIKTNSVNTGGTLNVLSAARETGVKKVIFASSSSVYGSLKTMPVSEEHPTEPISVYGASKLACEKYCKIYNDLMGLPVVILRYHTVYGPRQRSDMAIHKWTKLIAEGKPPVVYGDGNQTRDFTYIDDAIEGTLKAAEVDGIEGEIFNLGGGSRTSVNAVVGLLLQSSGREDIKPIHAQSNPSDVQDTYADITKAKKLLRYDPKVPLREGIKKYLEWFRAIKSA